MTSAIMTHTAGLTEGSFDGNEGGVGTKAEYAVMGAEKFMEVD